jgi:preprotein translocase subunit SecF
MQILKNPNFNFVRWRLHAIALSLVVIAIGIGSSLTRGLPLGVEFEGGTIVILKFDAEPNVAAIRSALATGLPGGDDAIVQRYGEADRHEVMIRVSEVGAEVAG